MDVLLEKRELGRRHYSVKRGARRFEAVHDVPKGCWRVYNTRGWPISDARLYWPVIKLCEDFETRNNM